MPKLFDHHRVANMDDYDGFITSTGYHGDGILVDKEGNPAMPGDTVTDFRGKKAVLMGGQAPRNAWSNGRVWVREFGVASEQEFYPSVYGLEWHWL